MGWYGSRADGGVEHRTQFLEATPGIDPTLAFLQALRDALRTDNGTIFRWAAHENTVLNQLRLRLLTAEDVPIERRAELVGFIESITERNEAGRKLVGPRNMIDLAKLAERHFFRPITAGSSSLKKVLPAVTQSSDTLRDLYSSRCYGTPEMPSLNLAQPQAWWVTREGRVCNPYELLPPVFQAFSAQDQAALDAGVAPELAEGGAAMAAYARLQFESLEQEERAAIEMALKRYCELDTLAMVMVVQAWQGWLTPHWAPFWARASRRGPCPWKLTAEPLPSCASSAGGRRSMAAGPSARRAPIRSAGASDAHRHEAEVVALVLEFSATLQRLCPGCGPPRTVLGRAR